MKDHFSISFLLLLFISTGQAQEDPAALVTPEAISARIAEHRKGDILVKTKPGKTVEIRQVRHEFLFGTAIPNSLAETHENAMSEKDRKMYLKILEDNFNYAVHENALKWYDCEKEPGEVDYSVADRIWELCAERNIPMRGHCIYWAKDEFTMDWLKTLDNETLRKAVVQRGTDVVRHFKGRITEFDLNNEMIHGDFFRRRLGYGIINEMAWIAKAANPDVSLFMNDYGILDIGMNTGAYILQIRNLLASGVPIEGIGCQAHRTTALPIKTPPARVQAMLDRLAELELPVKITECLFNYRDEQVQVEELQKLLPVYFAHPSVEAIVMWGFWEGDHWQPQCALWKKDWTPRPQAMAYRDLVFNQWWTATSGKADQTGSYIAEAFYGDYEISSMGETRKVSLSKKDGSIRVTFE